MLLRWHSRNEIGAQQRQLQDGAYRNRLYKRVVADQVAGAHVLELYLELHSRCLKGGGDLGLVIQKFLYHTIIQFIPVKINEREEVAKITEREENDRGTSDS